MYGEVKNDVKKFGIEFHQENSYKFYEVTKGLRNLPFCYENSYWSLQNSPRVWPQMLRWEQFLTINLKTV